MKSTRVFQSGHSQAVRIPHEFALDTDEVYIRRAGGGLLLLPKDDPWAVLEDALSRFTPDFLEEREQPPTQTRASL